MTWALKNPKNLLTFILELDDLANLFESDEDVLLRNDWNNLFVEKKYWELQLYFDDYIYTVKVFMSSCPKIFFRSAHLFLISKGRH